MKLRENPLGPWRMIGCLLLLARAVGAQPDHVYVNGTVLTLDGIARTTAGFAVSKGRFTAVGSTEEMRRMAGPHTAVVDLAGRIVLPGLYAAHDHFPQAGIVALTQVDLNSPPIGSMESVDDIVVALRKHAAKTPPGQWIAGRGYDDTLIKERRHPNRHDLDRVSTAHPIVIVHISGHLSAGNSRALALAGITRKTPQPKGGVIRKDPTGEPDGVIEESDLLRRHLPEPTPAQTMEAIDWAGRLYASKGVTTAVPAGGNPKSVRALAEAATKGLLPIRITTMMGAGSRETIRGPQIQGVPEDRLRVGAVKLWYDGSIQGYTGYLREPYHDQPEGTTGYRGYALLTQSTLLATVSKYHRLGIQVAVHGNGDAAIDDILDVFEQVQRDYPRPDARHRIEHCQTAREDQLDRMKVLGVTPSFFVGHVYYWGDRHRDIFLGPHRAARISPLASARRRGIRFTVHDDTPVTPVNPLQLVWVATQRLTRNGQVLGADQKIGVIDALRSVTSDAAWQNFEESTKGSIEPGKLADFVIVDRNPLQCTAEQLRALRVLETVVAGRTVFRQTR